MKFRYAPAGPGSILASVVAGTLILCAPVAPAGATDPEAEIRADCRREWPGNARMREHCITRQGKALAWFRSFPAPEGSAAERTLLLCMAKWRTPGQGGTEGGHNFRMIQHCTETELAAARRLKAN